MEDDRTGDPFTDDELAFLRHARFGELPARVAPQEMVETLESERPHVGPWPLPGAIEAG